MLSTEEADALALPSGRPQAWVRIVHAMGGGHDAPRGRVTSGPWRTALTLLPCLRPVVPRLIQQGRLVGVQRIPPDEAAELGRALTPPRRDAEALPTLASPALRVPSPAPRAALTAFRPF